MPKNQKLSATDEAILRMEPAAKEMKKRQLANKQAFLKTLREEAEQKRKGTYNPMLDAFLAVIGKEDGGAVMKMKDGGSTCRGMGAARSGGKFTGVK